MNQLNHGATWVATTVVQVVAALTLGASAGAQVVLYSTASDCTECGGQGIGTLYTIDPESAVATAVGTIIDSEGDPVRGVTGLAFLRDGRLVAAANGDEVVPRGVNGGPEQRAILVEIDRATGAAILSGEIINEADDLCGRMPDLTYDPSTSRLFGIGCPGAVLPPDTLPPLPKPPRPPELLKRGPSLYYLDPTTGEGKVIDTETDRRDELEEDGMGVSGRGNGLAWDPATGELFVAPGEAGRPNGLWTVDIRTGTATAVEGSLGNTDPLVNSLAFHPMTGVLYGIRKSTDPTEWSLVTIDVTDGSTLTSNILRNAEGNEIFGFDSLAFRGPDGCHGGPVGPCEPNGDGKAKLKLITSGGKESWRWKGTNTAKEDFGDPLGTTDYRVCIHDGMNTLPVLVAAQSVPAGENWKETSGGFKYKSKDGAPDGVTKVTLKEGTFGKARVKVKGKGVDVPELPLSNTLNSTIQIVNTEGSCWGSTFPQPVDQNDAEKFKGKN